MGTPGLGLAEEAAAEEEVAPVDWGSWGEEAEAATVTQIFDTKLYGFIDAYAEKVAKTPGGVDDGGETQWESNAAEYDVANFNVMLQGSILGRYRYFFNLASPGSGGVLDDEPLQVRNAWVELPVVGDVLQVRAGKLYRRFGLYNEILDATPTFIGIEPPELFDKDHLMVTRTTNLMVHGLIPVGVNTLSYALMTGNDEKAAGAIPLGADVFFEVSGLLKLGSSFYTSGGPAQPGRSVGEGSPRGGVVNWMAEDQYRGFGGYAQLTARGFTAQAEYWRAQHDARRDADQVALLADGGLNQAQLDRFFVNGDPSQGVGPLDVEYDIDTAYIRAGYEMILGHKEMGFTPYVQGDWYRNPEIVESKSLGGDGEAGAADDHQFFKYTLGAVFRPVPQVALKVDGSAHHLTYNGAQIFYPEIRVSLSYLWQLVN